MQPIIIIGTQRSGSNLLRLMLNQHSQIAAPHPPHILQTFFPLLPKYGYLDKPENFTQLVNDVCSFVMFNPVSWQVELNIAQILAKCTSPSLISIYTQIYENYATIKKKKFWCCKSMANLYYIPQIEAEGVRPFYIHLIRDGRDVAASFKKTIVGEKHGYHLAQQWKKDQITAEKNCRELAENRYIVIHYENLIQEPENTLRTLLNHLRLSFEVNLLNYHQTIEAQKTAEGGKMWNNVRKPLLANNFNKFLTQIGKEELLIFESIAGSTLEHYGYTPYFEQKSWTSSYLDVEIQRFDIENENMKREARLSFDPEGNQKRESQDNLVKSIKNRD